MSEHLRSEIFLAGTGDLNILKSRIYNLSLFKNEFSWTSKKSHFEAGEIIILSIWTDFALRRRDKKIHGVRSFTDRSQFSHLRSHVDVVSNLSFPSGKVQSATNREDVIFSRNVTIETFGEKSAAPGRARIGTFLTKRFPGSVS